MRVMLWGTYDLGKPRTRLLREALRRIDTGCEEIHAAVWTGVEDKSGLSGGARLAGFALRWLLAYPALIWRFLRARDCDVVVIGYLGLVDVLVLAPFARLRGIPIVWDAFLSLYDTYARDRGMAAEHSLKARALRLAERTACRWANVVVLDTAAHARLVAALHGVAAGKFASVFVGAEDEAFAALPPRAHAELSAGDTSDETPLHVLFYGQFIPLHGIDTIIEAVLSPRGRAFRWTIIGKGQEAPRIDAVLARAGEGAREGAAHVERIGWVGYGTLREQMARADICLGIFGTSEKAASVIPNKVFQALAAGMPLITRDSAAMRELAPESAPGLYLVPPADAAGLLDALEGFARDRAELPQDLHRDLQERFALAALTEDWRAILQGAVAR